ncbi:MAG: amidohydrolase [Firmicutes bacterium]|nr:amidohydrolase [Bacillota bacterium]
MKIIDFHTHPFYHETENVCFYKNTVLSPEDFKDIMKGFGVDKICGSVIERIDEANFDKIQQLNNSAITLKRMWGDFYEPGVHIHPYFVHNSIEELTRCREKGFKMVGELVPYFMDWEVYYNDAMHEIYEAVRDLGYKCVSIHTMQEESMDAALEAFPDITFVAAHPNDKACFLRHLERMERFDNYYLDLSGTGIFRFGLLKYGISRVGSERFLFGSDFPICNCNMYIAAVESERISDADKENIFYKNTERILGL